MAVGWTAAQGTVCMGVRREPWVLGGGCQGRIGLKRMTENTTRPGMGVEKMVRVRRVWLWTAIIW